MKWIITIGFVCTLPALVSGQTEKLKTAAGNVAYASGDFETANKVYENALEDNPDYKEALFNSGNALTRKSREIMEAAQASQNEEEKKAMVESAAAMSKKAASKFEKVASLADNAAEKNKSQYNLGNARLLGGEVDGSIEAYKEALRNDPTDDDARYNLAYAKWLKKQQEQQQNQDQQQDENQEQEEQEQNQENQENQENEQNQEQQQPQQLSKEEAEKMLDAMMNQEKELQDELNKKRHKAERIKIEKDW